MRGSTKSSRSVAVNALKRELIREAAKRVFLARGLSAASVREIALQAGYTTGAIYFHYASKEEIYADVLSASLSALHEAVSAAAAARGGCGAVSHRGIPGVHRLLSLASAGSEPRPLSVRRSGSARVSMPSSTATSTRGFSA